MYDFYIEEIHMRLFHVSEEKEIKIFHPRKPSRKDLVESVPLVWAIDEKRLPNFLTPRDCPRVTYHKNHQTSDEDCQRFFSSSTSTHVVAIEHAWFDVMKTTTLYIYEFDSKHFILQDAIAGFYVSKHSEVPIACHVIKDPFQALFDRGVELRVLDRLIDLRDQVILSTLNWSMCRMAHALPKDYVNEF